LSVIRQLFHTVLLFTAHIVLIATVLQFTHDCFARAKQTVMSEENITKCNELDNMNKLLRFCELTFP